MATPNAPTFADLLQKATDLGVQAGLGADVQIKFLLATAEGAYHNALDLNPNKHGIGIDDATKLSEAYYKARSGSNVFDVKADNQRKTIACTRTAVKIGGWTKGGNGEPIATINNLMTLRQKARKDPTKAKRVDDAANVFLKFSREQLKRDTLISDAELEQFCFKKVSDQPTVEQVIEGIQKQLTALVEGRAAGHTAQCNTQNILNARQAVTNELKAIATARNPQIKTSA